MPCGRFHVGFDLGVNILVPYEGYEGHTGSDVCISPKGLNILLHQFSKVSARYMLSQILLCTPNC